MTASMFIAIFYCACFAVPITISLCQSAKRGDRKSLSALNRRLFL